MPIVLKLYRDLGHGLKMCICFGYNPQIIFHNFFSQIEFSRFLGVYYYQDMNMLRIRFNLLVYIKKKIINCWGHKFSEFACFFQGYCLV